MKSNKNALLIIFITFLLTAIQCSPSSDSMHQVGESDTNTLTMLSPEKGAQDISINSEFVWKTMEGAAMYELQLSDQESFSNLIANLSVDSSKVQVNGLPSDSKIFWRVRKINEDQPQPQWSQTFDFTTESKSETSPPIATSLQYPSNNSYGRPLETNLEWAFVVNATNYQLQVATDENFENIFFKESTSETEFSIPNSELELGQTYYWKVLANVDGVETSWSDTWTFNTETTSSAITLVYPQDGSEDEAAGLTFEWESIEGVSSYNIQVATDNSFEHLVIDEVTTDTLFKASDLDVEKNYFWRTRKATGQTGVKTSVAGKQNVSAGNVNNNVTSADAKSKNAGWSNVWSFRTKRNAKPRAQLSLPANYSTNLSTDLSFRWGKINGVSKYRVMVATDNSFSNPEYDETVSGTYYKIEGLESGRTYYWGVQAAGSNKWSDTWVFTTGKKGSIPAVTLTAPDNNSSNLATDLTFKWKKISGVSNYRVMVATDNSFSNPEYDATVSKTSFAIDDLERNQTYYWGVMAEGSDQWSDTWIFNTGNKGGGNGGNGGGSDGGGNDESVPPVTLSAPSNNSSSQSTELTFKWKEIEGVSNYRVMVATDNSFSNPEYDETVSKTSYTIDDLESGETYYWGVKATGSSNPWSDTWSFTTSEGTTGIPSVELSEPLNNEENVSTAVILEWEEINNVDEYRVQIAMNNSFSNSSIVENVMVDDTNYETDALGLSYDETYYWRVRADEGSEWSDVWIFNTAEQSLFPPVTLTAPTNNSSNQPTDLTLEWQEIAGATEYQVQVSTDNSFSNPEYSETVSQPFIDISGLESDQTYYWGVRAAGADQWSNTWSFTTESNSHTPPPSMNGIVGVSNNNFVIDGQVFRFAGTNAYYLHNYEKLDPQFVTSTLNAFEEAGVTVVRMWGFYDGYDCGYSAQDPNENVIQTAPGEYSEEALRDLDNVIAKGKERGIRFLLPFINYWDELGGVCQYNTWAGASNPSTNMSYFINSNSAQNWFKDYINMLLNRVNTVTGVAYKNESAIFGWEIMNEGRNTGADPAVLRDWYREIAQYIKSIDSNHILATGEEGFDEGSPSEYSLNQYSNTYVLRAGEGTSYIMNTAIPEIDFASAHWYPSDWGLGSSFGQSLINAQHAWFEDHQNIAEEYGKPFILGEYGYAGWGNQEVLNIYNDIWDYAEDVNLDGSFIWQLTTDYVKCYEFGGNICWPAGRQDADLYNNFEDHIQNIRQ